MKSGSLTSVKMIKCWLREVLWHCSFLYIWFFVHVIFVHVIFILGLICYNDLLSRSWTVLLLLFSTGNLLIRRAPPQEGGHPPHEEGPGPSSWGFFLLCEILHHDYRRKNQNCKKRQYCLWRFMGPLSMHQFIEISICALENKIFLFSNAQSPQIEFL